MDFGQVLGPGGGVLAAVWRSRWTTLGRAQMKAPHPLTPPLPCPRPAPLPLQVPPVHGGQDPVGVHQDRRPPDGGAGAAAHGCDQRGVVAAGRPVLQEERGVPGRGGERQPAGEQQRHRGSQRGGGRTQDARLPERHGEREWLCVRRHGAAPTLLARAWLQGALHRKPPSHWLTAAWS